MGALTDKLCDFLDAHTAGVLATASPEGKPGSLSFTSRVTAIAY